MLSPTTEASSPVSPEPRLVPEAEAEPMTLLAPETEGSEAPMAASLQMPVLSVSSLPSSEAFAPPMMTPRKRALGEDPTGWDSLRMGEWLMGLGRSAKTLIPNLRILNP